ncbi:hypothetical protein D5282_00505 [bacterium 1xD8-48]|nr:hypothetical protein [bacterium 1xD8-48]
MQRNFRSLRAETRKTLFSGFASLVKWFKKHLTWQACQMLFKPLDSALSVHYTILGNGGQMVIFSEMKLENKNLISGCKFCCQFDKKIVYLIRWNSFSVRTDNNILKKEGN